MAISVSPPQQVVSGRPAPKSRWSGLLQIGQKDKNCKQQRTSPSSPPACENSVARPSKEQRRPGQKYSRSGKVLGTGANCSVELVRRKSDDAVLAVKRFRSRNAVETDRDYLQKIVGEFRVGSLLHHGNIIQTFELFEEEHQWHQVMEYAPHDLFEAVLSKKMSSEEIDCSFMQILNGVSYLHRLGLTHRDLKLENVVVTERGIMKLVDFGCAALCRDPDTKKRILSTDVVGCEAYMAPEILHRKAYDPQHADIWSLGIMYCCMALGRFPWKIALPTVDAFKRYASGQISRESAEGENQQKSFDKTVLSTSFDKISGKGDTVVIQTSMIINVQDEKTECAWGPESLLRTLPTESRFIIGEMLQVMPQARPSLQQICDSAWVKQSDVCSQDESGKVHCTGRHQHTLRSR